MIGSLSRLMVNRCDVNVSHSTSMRAVAVLIFVLFLGTSSDAFHPFSRKCRHSCWTIPNKYPGKGHRIQSPLATDKMRTDSPRISIHKMVSESSIPEFPEFRDDTMVDLSFSILQGSASESETSERMRSVIQSTIATWRDRYESDQTLFRNSPRSPGEAPTLAEYLKEGKFHPEEIVDRLQHLKGLNVENFWRIVGECQQYLVRGVEEGESLQRSIAEVLQKIPAERMAQSIQSFVSVLQTQGLTSDSLQASVRALDMEELGVWYTGAVGFVWLVVACSSSESARKDLVSKLNEATATLGKESEEASLRERTLLVEKERMEGQVQELSQATVSVANELKQLKAEKAKRDYAVAEMKSELRALKNELRSQQMKEKEVASKLTKAEKLLQSETQKLQKELEKRDLAEKALLERISALQSQLGETEEPKKPAVIKPSSVAEPKKPATTKRTSKEKVVANFDVSASESEPMPTPEVKGVFFASVESPMPPTLVEPTIVPVKSTKKTTSKKSSLPSSAVEPESPPLKVSKKITAKTPSSKGSTEAKEPDLPARRPSPVKGDKTKSLTSSTKATTKVSKPSVEEPSPTVDWSNLSAAAIRRKTISDLVAFLESKGESTIGSDGKAMKKPELVEKVMSVL